MGAAKLPEQIVQRVEEGLRALEEDRRLDPVIERLRALPVTRKVVPEKKSIHRQLAPGAEEGTRTIARKIALQRQVKAVLLKIERLKADDATLVTGAKAVEDQIAALKRRAKQLRKAIPGEPASKKRSNKKRLLRRQPRR